MCAAGQICRNPRQTKKYDGSRGRRHIIDNSVAFEDKINRAIGEIYRILGRPAPDAEKRKYLIRMPDVEKLTADYDAVPVEMMQTYLVQTKPGVERRIRQQKGGKDYLYFYTEKRLSEDGKRWVIERPFW